MAGPVRLGVVGCGLVAEGRHLPALAQIDEISVRAVADIDFARAERVSQRFHVPRAYRTAEELIGDPAIDAVAVLVPATAHADVGFAALERQKHLFIEKPLALSLTEADALVECARTQPVKAVMGFNLRSHRLVREARQIVATGGIGGVQAVTTTFNDARLEQAGLQPWRTRRSLGGGTLLEKAVHHFDLWRFLLDDEVVDVFARTRSGRSEDEVAAVSAVTERGVLLNALSSDLTSSVHELTVWGDAGSIRVDLYRFDGLERADLEALPGSPRVRLERLGAGMATLLRTAPELRRGGVFDSSYGAEWRAFAAAIRGNDEPTSSLVDGVKALEIALAAQRSAESGEPIPLDGLRAPSNTGDVLAGETTG